MSRQVKPHSNGRIHRRGLHIRANTQGLLFLYLDEQKICRYYPDRQALEFKDHHKGGRVVEANVTEFADGLQRLAEVKEG